MAKTSSPDFCHLSSLTVALSFGDALARVIDESVRATETEREVDPYTEGAYDDPAKDELRLSERGRPKDPLREVDADSVPRAF